MSRVIDGHRVFLHKVRNFPEEVFEFKPSDHLFKFMWAVLEDPGVGAFKKYMAIAQLSEHMGNTHFSDLDGFFGSWLRLERLPGEQYSYDPFRDRLTTEEWNEVFTKDARFRERLKSMMSSFQRGGTVEGIAMMAEAVSGFECQVIEAWRTSESLGVSVGRLGAAKEFVIVPKTTSLTPSLERAILLAVDRIKPANTVASVDPDGLDVHTVVTIRYVASPTHDFELKRFIVDFEIPFSVSNRPVMSKVKKVGRLVQIPTRAMVSPERAWSLNSSIIDVQLLGQDDNDDYFSIGVDRVVDESEQFGPWRQIENVDSPDNFPDGKFEGVAEYYDNDGNYLFAWESQAQYIEWLTGYITALGGEVQGNRYRLPIALEVVDHNESSPFDALSEPEVIVRSSLYPVRGG